MSMVEALARQHLIDPEICIRCNTCEASCPIGAITHDDRNYVVKFDACNSCGACISPCPTGAIDNWRQVSRATPYSIEEQFGWESLPPESRLDMPGDSQHLPADVEALTGIATSGQGGLSAAPWSAEKATVNLYPPTAPAVAKVAGNLRLTDDSASSDIRHIVLDFGAVPFPVLEGQSIGILPPEPDSSGRPHSLRLYSVASPREGERRGYNNVSLTVKRVAAGQDGAERDGVCSNYLCNLKPGDQVRVVGPYGSTFLMPNHPQSNLLMICTGTGSAPMRAMTERRRRRKALAEGGEMMLFFGARSPEELPYFGPLQKLPKEFIDINFAFSRVRGEPKRYVQDRIRERSADVARLLSDGNTYVYICGLKGMESGVDEAFRVVCAEYRMDWDALVQEMRSAGRYHVETY
ncbi:MAG: benzoyl-CoA 2,3-epoxidase subunit BoxA [Gammaproteobacteria bacterium]|jgi:benzoyl-CoA 2,3-dioxygenase component A|nr:benzoyl-CoA 2,3-epoxidase subunit BoxA [Gammaproteobacteria bacterium]